MRYVVCAGAILMLVGALGARKAPTVAERLGYKASDRLLILNGDDIGNSHAANVASIEAMERGLMTSGTIMVPCPWFPEIARYAKAHPEKDFGLHLTHTSEWQSMRWRPVAEKSEVPGLFDPEGYFWRTEEEVYKHSNAKEAEIEARAQIRKALAAGIDVTHIDSHMGAMQLNPAFHEAYLKLGKEFNIPVRMAGQEIYAAFGFPRIRAMGEEMGLVFPDRLHYNDPQKQGETRKDYWTRVIKALRPGITEILIHAAKDSDEIRSMTNAWKERVDDYQLWTHDPDIRKLIQDEKITMIGFRALRALQRK